MIDFIKACKSHSKYRTFDGACVLETESSAGQPLIIKITPNTLKAYRKHKPTILKTTKSGKKIKLDTESRLEQYFHNTPVMEIWRNDDEFVVDFEAGMQRGRYRHQTRDDLCNHLTFDDTRMGTKNPWLSWIGLDCSEDLIDGFTKGDLEK